MLSSSCSHSLSQWGPILLPSVSRLRVINRPGISPLQARNSRISESHSKLSKHKWKISCFRNEDFAPADPKSDSVEHSLPEKLVNKPEVDSSTDVRRNWISTVREAADIVLKAIGSQWTVPWTAETIMQSFRRKRNGKRKGNAYETFRGRFCKYRKLVFKKRWRVLSKKKGGERVELTGVVGGGDEWMEEMNG